MYLARHQTPDFARQILQGGFPGVCGVSERIGATILRERSPRRFLGLTNVDGEGIAGIELAFEQWLQGVPGKKRFIKDLHGEAVRDFGLITRSRAPARHFL